MEGFADFAVFVVSVVVDDFSIVGVCDWFSRVGIVILESCWPLVVIASAVSCGSLDLPSVCIVSISVSISVSVSVSMSVSVSVNDSCFPRVEKLKKSRKKNQNNNKG